MSDLGIAVYSCLRDTIHALHNESSRAMVSDMVDNILSGGTNGSNSLGKPCENISIAVA